METQTGPSTGAFQALSWLRLASDTGSLPLSLVLEFTPERFLEHSEQRRAPTALSGLLQLCYTKKHPHHPGNSIRVKTMLSEPGQCEVVVVHAFNSSPQEAEVGGSL